MQDRSGLGVFRNYLDHYRRLIVVGVAASAVPLAGALASLTPAWPRAVEGITAVAQLLVLALAFQLLRSARRTAVNRVMILSTVVFCVLLPIYFFLLSLFTYAEPLSRERFTKGFECTTDAMTVYGNACPLLGLDEIAKAAFEAEVLWTVYSVSIMKSVILIVWLACFGALSTALGSFAVFQMGSRDKRSSRDAHSPL